MKYVVAGITITNDVVFADGTRSDCHIGGSVFAVEGVRAYEKDVLYVSNVGKDYEKYYGEWMKANALSYDGLKTVMDKTHYNIVQYHPDGTWYEYSIYGEDYFSEKRKETDITAQQVIDACKDGAKGLYIDCGAKEDFWKRLDEVKATGVKVFWEPPTSNLVDEDKREATRKAIEMVDMYTMNKPESFAYFGVDSEEEVLKILVDYGKPCFYRVGSKGSYMVSGGSYAFAPSIDVGPFIDPTGCGNCSSATSMFAHFEGHDNLRVAVMANVAAGYNGMQYGPFPAFTDEVMAQAKDLVEKYIADLTK